MIEQDPTLEVQLETLAEQVYQAVLGRPIDEGSRRTVVRDLAMGCLNRSGLVDALVASPEYQEATAISREVAAAREHCRAFGVLGRPVGRGLSERVVEVPWVLSRYRGERRVLDLGSANAPPVYRELLSSLAVPELVAVDLASPSRIGLRSVQADIRALPVASNSIDLVFCVSTIEHVGRANDRYGIDGREDPDGDVRALREIARVLRVGARALVTVPFGRFENHGWFVQYDSRSWVALVNASGLRIAECDCFVFAPSRGWTRARSPVAARRASYGDRAPAARAVLCASLERA